MVSERQKKKNKTQYVDMIIGMQKKMKYYRLLLVKFLKTCNLPFKRASLAY